MKTEQIDALYKVCPGAMAAVEDYLDGHMRSTPQGIAELEALKGQFGSDKKAATRIFLAMGDRFLYEFFDEKEIYIMVEAFATIGDKGEYPTKVKWMPAIVGVNRDTESFGSRQEAEANAFGIALKHLESKLG